MYDMILATPLIMLNVLKETRTKLETQSSELNAQLHSINTIIKQYEGFLSPNVSIAKIKDPSGRERYIGKFKVILPDGKSKYITINIDSASTYTGKDDPLLIKVAREKATEKFYQLNPNYLAQIRHIV
jgi:hypothetical protein